MIDIDQLLADSQPGPINGPIAAAIKRGDIETAARIASERFGVPVPATTPPAGQGRRGWTDSTWLMWFKNRAVFQFGGTATDESVRTCRLHVGFLSLPETEEMISALREPNLELVFRVARSKIFGTPFVPIPIDRVAMRVAPRGDV